MSESRYGFKAHTQAAQNARATYKTVQSAILAREIATKKAILEVYDIPGIEKEINALERELKNTLFADTPFSEMKEWCY